MPAQPLATTLHASMCRHGGVTCRHVRCAGGERQRGGVPGRAGGDARARAGAERPRLRRAQARTFSGVSRTPLPLQGNYFIDTDILCNPDPQSNWADPLGIVSSLPCRFQQSQSRRLFACRDRGILHALLNDCMA